MNKTIYPCLWFNNEAKQAAEFYCSVFSDTVITTENPMVVTFESAGQKFMCLNGGPKFTFNPSISFFVFFKNIKEINKTWKNLLKGGSALMPIDKYDWSTRYGWVKDQFGITWQLSLGDMWEVSQKFSPALMFTGKQHGKAEQAIQFYTSVFECSTVTGIMRYDKREKESDVSVKHAQFKLSNHAFLAMDSILQDDFSFNEAISFVVECETQEKIDYYWNKLTDGGEESQCGWLRDKFGVSWQIVPSILEKLMSDPSKSDRIINAFLKMKKFEIEKLVNV